MIKIVSVPKRGTGWGGNNFTHDRRLFLPDMRVKLTE